MLTRARASLAPQPQPQAMQMQQPLADVTLAKRRSTRSSGAFASGPTAATTAATAKDTNLLIDIAAPLPMPNFASPFKPTMRMNTRRSMRPAVTVEAERDANADDKENEQHAQAHSHSQQQQQEDDEDESDRQWAELNKPTVESSSSSSAAFTPRASQRSRRSHQAPATIIDENAPCSSELLNSTTSTPSHTSKRSVSRMSLTPNPSNSAAATARRRRSSAIKATAPQQQQLAPVVPVEEEDFSGSIIPGPLDCTNASEEEDDVVNSSLSLPPVSFTPSSYARTRRSMARAAGFGAAPAVPTRRSDRRSLHHTQLQLLKQLVQDDEQQPHSEENAAAEPEQLSADADLAHSISAEAEEELELDSPVHLADEFAQQVFDVAETSMEKHAEESEQAQLPLDDHMQSAEMEELQPLEQSVASIIAPMDESPVMELSIEEVVEEQQQQQQQEEEAEEEQLEAEVHVDAEADAEADADVGSEEHHDEIEAEEVIAVEPEAAPATLAPVVAVATPAAAPAVPASVRKTRATASSSPVELLAGSSQLQSRKSLFEAAGASDAAAASLFGISGMALAFYGVTPPSTPLGARNIMLPRSSAAKSGKKGTSAKRGSAAAHAQEGEEEEEAKPRERVVPVAEPSCTPLQITPRSNSRRKSLQARHDDDDEEQQQPWSYEEAPAAAEELATSVSAPEVADAQNSFESQAAAETHEQVAVMVQDGAAEIAEKLLVEEPAHAEVEAMAEVATAPTPVQSRHATPRPSAPSSARLAPAEELLPTETKESSPAPQQQKRSKKSLLRAIASSGANAEIPDDILAQLFTRPAASPVKEAPVAVASASVAVAATVPSPSPAPALVAVPAAAASTPVAAAPVAAPVAPMDPVDLAALFSTGPQLIAYSPKRSPKQNKAATPAPAPVTPAGPATPAARAALAVASASPAKPAVQSRAATPVKHAAPAGKAATPVAATPRLRSRLSTASVAASPAPVSADLGADVFDEDECDAAAESSVAAESAPTLATASLRRLRPAEIALYVFAYMVVLAALLYLF